MDQSPLQLERDGSRDAPGICTIWLEQPGSTVVVLDQALLRRIEGAIAAVPRGATGVILASRSSRVFVAGADLKSIQAMSDGELDRYLAEGQRIFGTLADLPCHTVAAINGAALGGGLELAMHCDGLVGAPSASGKPYPVGLPEAGLAICPGWGGTNLLPARMEPEEAIRRTMAGKPLLFGEAVQAGLFDAVADAPEGLLDAARRWLDGRRAAVGAPRRDGAPSRWIGRPDVRSAVTAALLRVRDEMPGGAAASEIADAMEAGLEEGWQGALGAERRSLLRLRSTPEARAAIQAFFERAASKG